MTSAKLGRALDGLYEAAVTPDAWPEALRGFARATQSVGCRFRPVRSEPGEAPLPASPDLDDFLAEFRSQGWFERDPRTLRGAPLGEAGRVVVLEHDIASDEERRQLPFYQEFLRRHDLLWWAGIVFAVDGRQWSMSIHRRPGEGPFTPADARVMADVAPHLGRVVSLAGKLPLAHAAGAVHALERIGRAGLVVDAMGRVVAVNALAEDMASEGELAVSHGRLRAADAPSDRRLRSSIANGCAARVAGAPIPSPVFVARREGRPLMVEVLPATGPMRDVFRRIAALVVVTDLNARRGPRNDIVREAFGLTSAEARLASILAGGEDLRRAADQLGVTYETARTQLRAIFAKVQVGRQAELAAVLAPMARDIEEDRRVGRRRTSEPVRSAPIHEIQSPNPNGG